MDIHSLTFLGINLLIFLLKFSKALTTISPSQAMNDSQNLVSRDGTFELGFFSPGSSKNSYLGIWYHNIPVRTVVWVANRHNPMNDSSGLLVIDNSSNLVLVSSNNSVVWSSNSTMKAQSPVVELLDSGNLVLRDEKDGNLENYLWQSFDYPSDTLLPGMKLGWDLRRGLDRHLTSWKSPDDPSPGDFIWGTQLQGNPELVMWKGKDKYYRSAPWNGIGFSGAPDIRQNQVFDFNFVLTEDEAYYIYNLKNKSAMLRIVVNQTIYYRQRYTWSEVSKSWTIYGSVPRDTCDNYGICGAYGNCIISNMPICQCLDNFKPQSPDKWNSMDWSQGCVRNKPLNCSGDGFIKFDRVRWPDSTNTRINRTMNLNECRAKCLRNCACMAYANTDVRAGGSGCSLWFGDLVDIRQFPAGGQELYIRMNASEIEDRAATKMKIGLIVAASFAAVMLMIGFYIWRRKAKCIVSTLSGRTKTIFQNDRNNDGQREDLELPLFEFDTIENATCYFSMSNKLGEGGFGPVYKGKLVDGHDIAVKRLSKSSGQGPNEFKNEVILITKLQHRNLVKLLGCCIERDERMLVYEYMPNRSLDSFIFDQKRSKQLDWSKRFNIICGIARGLLYLHQDSRLRIIHRDLKASNVLLDDNMNPKISDFGLARTFGADQTEGNTSKVVGTYGYMAPEYATDGLFSVKSDVFSFGILMLEILTGKKSRGFYHPNHSLSLIGHVWKLWKEGKPLEMIDAWSGESSHLSEVMRCIHISLLCVQQHPDNRPSMASVVLMLGGESTLPQPIEPGFLMDRDSLEAYSSLGKIESCSTNEITASLLEPR